MNGINKSLIRGIDAIPTSFRRLDQALLLIYWILNVWKFMSWLLIVFKWDTYLFFHHPRVLMGQLHL